MNTWLWIVLEKLGSFMSSFILYGVEKLKSDCFYKILFCITLEFIPAELIRFLHKYSRSKNLRS